MRFSFIQEHRGQWPVGALCRTLGVTRPGYGAWQRRHEANQEVPSLHRQEDARLTLCIKAAHRQAPALWESACASHAAPAGRVHQPQAGGSPDASSRIARRVPGTPQTLHHAVQPSAAGGREFFGAALYTRAGRHGEPGLVWRHHYVPTAEGWLYLATVQDLFSRRIVGWALGENLEAELVCEALSRPCKRAAAWAAWALKSCFTRIAAANTRDGGLNGRWTSTALYPA